MKQAWQRLALKVDALSLRERAIIFGAAALILVTIVNLMVLDPLFVKQKKLSAQIMQDQAKIAEIRTEINQKIKSGSFDPDAANRVQIQKLKSQATQMQGVLLDMQKGLVSPDKMAVLLEDILKRDGQLRLMSLKTLPVSSLIDLVVPDNKAPDNKIPDKTAGAVAAAAAAAGTTTPAATLATEPGKNVDVPAQGAVYRHGVEITVEGSYLDMMHYVAALEAMPWQLFWGRARLNVDEYPKATLTLTLFTLSLDKKWLNL